MNFQIADQIICRTVISRLEWRKAETICLYMSRLDEVDTKPLLAAALTAEKTVVFPRIEKDVLILHRIDSIKNFVRGKYNILEPKKSCKKISPAEVDLFIVPGVAFDRSRNRMGRGKGYYDRLLASVVVPKIGVAYEYQILAKLSRTSYDVPMTLVVTESRVYEH